MSPRCSADGRADFGFGMTSGSVPSCSSCCSSSARLPGNRRPARRHDRPVLRLSFGMLGFIAKTSSRNSGEYENHVAFDNVSVVKQANVYFDGKCVSHTVQFADGSRKTRRRHPAVDADLQHRRAGSHGRRRRQLPRAPQGRGVEDLRAGQSFSRAGQLIVRHRLR
jgi:hypothetical protein